MDSMNTPQGEVRKPRPMKRGQPLGAEGPLPVPVPGDMPALETLAKAATERAVRLIETVRAVEASEAKVTARELERLRAEVGPGAFQSIRRDLSLKAKKVGRQARATLLEESRVDERLRELGDDEAVLAATTDRYSDPLIVGQRYQRGSARRAEVAASVGDRPGPRELNVLAREAVEDNDLVLGAVTLTIAKRMPARMRDELFDIDDFATRMFGPVGAEWTGVAAPALARVRAARAEASAVASGQAFGGFARIRSGLELKRAGVETVV